MPHDILRDINLVYFAMLMNGRADYGSQSRLQGAHSENVRRRNYSILHRSNLTRHLRHKTQHKEVTQHTAAADAAASFDQKKKS